MVKEPHVDPGFSEAKIHAFHHSVLPPQVTEQVTGALRGSDYSKHCLQVQRWWSFGLCSLNKCVQGLENQNTIEAPSHCTSFG
jgi:hypothetical protein